MEFPFNLIPEIVYDEPEEKEVNVKVEAQYSDNPTLDNSTGNLETYNQMSQFGEEFDNYRSTFPKKVLHCSECGYTTRHKGNLNRHRRSHTGEKPFKCSMCDYCSKRKDMLAEHIRKHTGEKPFKCSCCSYRTRQRGNLHRHYRVHTRKNAWMNPIKEEV